MYSFQNYQNNDKMDEMDRYTYAFSQMRKEIEWQTIRQIDRQTIRQIDRQTIRQIDRQTIRQPVMIKPGKNAKLGKSGKFQEIKAL